ncbi:MAG: bifunctional nuclease family protein [Parabacteroides sp.]
METRIKLHVKGLANSQAQSGAYALILAEDEGPRRIPIIIGTAEAQSIAISLEHIRPPRPLTHDLFVSFLHAYGVELEEVFIYKFNDGIFYSELHLTDGSRRIELDSRTSDAIGIALRYKCPVYTTPEILEQCGVILEEVTPKETPEQQADNALLEKEPEEIQDEAELQRWLGLLDASELQERMDKAIEEEHYEYAKMYKDEMQRRQGKKE